MCLYDSRTHFFVAARDRYGIKPLFYTFVEGRLLIAAEIKAFLPLGWKPEWDVKSLMDGGWGQDQRTLFKGVHKVRPAHCLTCDSFEHVDHGQYWDIEYPDKYAVETRTDEEMVLGVRERMLEAIRLRLKADVPVGVYLSGGIDSSVIAGMFRFLLVLTVLYSRYQLVIPTASSSSYKMLVHLLVNVTLSIKSTL